MCKKNIQRKKSYLWKKKCYGLYISGHPLDKIRDQIETRTNINTSKMRQIGEDIEGKISRYQDGQFVKYAGIISSIKKKYTKNNTIMAFITVEDLYGSAELIVFENCYNASSNSLIIDNVVLVEGRLSIREDEEIKIVAREIKDFEMKKKQVLTFDITDLEEDTKAKLRGMIKYFMGDKNNMPVAVIDNEESKSCGAIYTTLDIIEEFKELLGEERVELKEV